MGPQIRFGTIWTSICIHPSIRTILVNTDTQLLLQKFIFGQSKATKSKGDMKAYKTWFECKGMCGIEWVHSDIWLLHGLVNIISNELFVPKSLIMTPIERFSLSTFSGCYTESFLMQWMQKEQEKKEEEREKQEIKCIRTEKKKEKEIDKKNVQN